MSDVKMPDGTIIRNVPEGTTRSQLLARVNKANQAKKPTSFWQGVAEGIHPAARNMARLVDNINPLTMVSDALGITDTQASRKAWEQKYQEKLAKSKYRGSTAGKITGGIAATLPTLALPGGALAQGAAGGALLSEGNDISNVAKDAAIGALAGKAGEMLARGAAGIISPRVAPVVKRLQQQGIRMTPGQILGAGEGTMGKAVKVAEDRASSIPVVGDIISGAKRRGVEDFNRSVLNEPLKSIGESLPKSVGVGHEGVAHVEQQLGKAYDDILPKLSATGDTQFVDDLANIHADAQTMAPDRSKQFNAILNDLGRFWKPGNVLSGKDLKAVESRLGERIRNYGSGADPDARDLAGALRQVQGAVRDLAARQNPAEAAKLRAINEGWAKFTRIQRASAFGSKGGEFTPGQLKTATRIMDRSARKAASARGDALLQKLAEDAQAVLPSSVPDSGTAGRLMPFILGGTGYLSPAAAAAGGAAMLPYTQAGGRAAEWLLTGRQGPAASGLADLLRQYSPMVGVSTVPLVAQQH